MKFTKDKDKGKALNKGAALLVVLGFLAFITVSAVAFSVYMRSERQATSNYMHSVSARHMLETALYRAIDEIDAELRIIVDNTNSRFPDWKTYDHRDSRIRASPIVSTVDSHAEAWIGNLQEARVLSLEALGFLPAIVVNDVRYQAVMTRTETDRDVIPGAKWRPISMPIQNAVRITSSDSIATNSGGQTVVGRYGYVCANLCDMLDVNGASVQVRSISNRVNIAHLFEGRSATAAVDFDKQRSNDVYYATLQDFYNCMRPSSAESRKYFARGVLNNQAVETTDSPYQTFLRDNDNGAAFNGAGNHVLITDGMAKPEPCKEKACNFLLNPPLTDSGANPEFSTEFKDALLAAFPSGSLIGNRQGMISVASGDAAEGGAFATMLADYLSPDDNIQRRVDVPSVKLAPMVSQILIPDFMAPRLYPEKQGVAPNEQTVVYAQLVGGPISDLGKLNDALRQAGVHVQLCWPFRNMNVRSVGEYKLEVEGWLYIQKDKTENFTSVDFQARDSRYYFSGDKPFTIPNSALQNPGNINNCFFTEQVGITFSSSLNDLQKAEVLATVTGSGTTITPPANFRTALVLFVRVKQGNVIVDAVPQFLAAPPDPGQSVKDWDESQFRVTPKIYFEAEARDIMRVPAIDDPSFFDYTWYTLAVPDPRFNHRASNWLQIEAAQPSIPPSRPAISSHLSAFIQSWLLGKDGRDSDIFMSVSGTGTLQSPGELGFIIRPYNFDQAKGENVNFSGRTGLNRAVDDSDMYYRTVRLYNHTDDGSNGNAETQRRDPVFEYFYAANADGTCAGSKTRVNPLSPLDAVLEAAIHRVPYDYWIATENCSDAETYKNSYIGYNDPKWETFADAWLDALTSTVDREELARYTGLSNGRPYRSIRTVYPGLKPETAPTATIAQSWYSSDPNNRKFIFGLDNAPDLYEVDRKMLYAFSLDTFSDRQQLFLYILQAERTAPATGAEAKSLAGGRAVALVWRDPYPKGTVITENDMLGFDNGTWYDLAGGFSGDTRQFGHLPFGRSPWWQTKKGDDKNPSVREDRMKGYHDHQILFFKQLDN